MTNDHRYDIEHRTPDAQDLVSIYSRFANERDIEATHILCLVGGLAGPANSPPAPLYHETKLGVGSTSSSLNSWKSSHPRSSPAFLRVNWRYGEMQNFGLICRVYIWVRVLLVGHWMPIER